MLQFYGTQKQLLSFQEAIQWLEGHLLSCPSRKYLHIECPGCGFQRSVIALLRGEWLLSWQLYPASMVIIALCVVTALHIRFEFKHGAAIIKWLQIFAGTIILISYSLKIIHHQIQV